MQYLLDTHILLWWLADDRKLSKKEFNVIADNKNIIFVSAVSSWEIEIKKALGKLQAPDNLIEEIQHTSFMELPITIKHTCILNKLPDIHNDPFDRLLIAQAISENYTLITDDKVFAKYPIKIL